MTAIEDFGNFYRKIAESQMEPLERELNHLFLNMVTHQNHGRIGENILHSPMMLRSRAPIGLNVPRQEKLEYREQSFPRIGLLDERRIAGVAYDPFSMRVRSRRVNLPPVRFTYATPDPYEKAMHTRGLSLKNQRTIQEFQNKQISEELNAIDQLAKESRTIDSRVQSNFDETGTPVGSLPASRSRLVYTPSPKSPRVRSGSYLPTFGEEIYDEGDESIQMTSPPGLLEATPDFMTPESSRTRSPPGTIHTGNSEYDSIWDSYTISTLVAEIKGFQPSFQQKKMKKGQLINKLITERRKSSSTGSAVVSPGAMMRRFNA